MRRPTRVRNTQRAAQAARLNEFFEFDDAPGGADPFDMLVENGHAGRVVAAVLELFQPFEQNGHGVTLGHCSDYPAHGSPSEKDAQEGINGTIGANSRGRRIPVISFAVASNPA